MPRGSGHIDLSQRPRREAPGLLTGVAILERELGLIDYERHKAERRLKQKPGPTVARRLDAELGELAQRRSLVLAKLDELHDEYEERTALRDGGRNLRDTAPRTRRQARDDAG